MTAAERRIAAELARAAEDGVTVEQDPGVSGDGTYLEGYLAACRVCLELAAEPGVTYVTVHPAPASIAQVSS